jgi:hypothetical protein
MFRAVVYNLWVISMKDFKRLPKMATGGTVNKFDSGFYKEPRKLKIDGEEYSPVEMPTTTKRSMRIGDQDVKPVEMPTVNRKRGGSVGLYANIHAKRERIKAGSGEKMRKPGAKGAPTKQAFVESAKTAKK